jgi:nitroimidazol reductase NimA-like FMN-containing flavoprotein (pyridoxamine 5'-phosphate oxidase superfamily)
MPNDPAAPSERTRIHRHPERGAYDRATVHRILDDALICHVAWVEDGRPRLLPTIQARIGDILYLHGSRGARAWKAVAAGTEVCVEATVVDELVLARTSPAHSMNYRSVVLYGRGREVTDPEELRLASRAITAHVLPGREDDAAEPIAKDYRKTIIFAVGIDEASAKVRTGPPVDDPENMGLNVWAGVLPLRTVAGDPLAAPDLGERIAEPDYLRSYERPAGA